MLETEKISQTINLIKLFFQNYLKKEEQLLALKIMHEIPMQKSFLRNFMQTETIALKLIENEAPKFNIFDIININHLEARFHTPFLASLLSPNATHRQGRLFFDSFVKHLFGKLFDTNSIRNISIAQELSDYNNGRMDIVIFYEESDTRKQIVIENKIYHYDEKEQLARYYRYLTQTQRLNDGQYHIIYLTPYGSKPTTESISPDLYELLKEKNALTEWGYYQDISTILESVKASIKAPVVAETIHQYLLTIEEL